jgi:hypothetical protein
VLYQSLTEAKFLTVLTPASRVRYSYANEAATCSFLTAELGMARRSEKNCLWNSEHS